MLSLEWKKPWGNNYPSNNFPSLQNLLNITERNVTELNKYLDRTNFVHDTSNDIPSLIIRSLGIEADWELDYLIDYTKMRTSSIASTLGLVSMTSSGRLVSGGSSYYGPNSREYWCVIEQDSLVNEVLSLDTLVPVIPLYSTSLEHSYTPKAHMKVSNKNTDNQFAVIGVDFVKLAICWWLYLKEEEGSLGVFLNKFIYKQTVLVSNQLTIINTLYEVLVLEKDLKSVLSKLPNHNFTLYNYDRLYKELLEFTIYNLNRNKLQNFGHLINIIPNIYAKEVVDYTNYVEGGLMSILTQSSWVWQLPLIKLYSIYLKIANTLGYRAGDITSTVNLTKVNLIRNYNKISNAEFKIHVKEITETLLVLNKDNLN